MRIDGITLRELRMQLVTPFQISVARTNVRRILLLEANVGGMGRRGQAKRLAAVEAAGRNAQRNCVGRFHRD